MLNRLKSDHPFSTLFLVFGFITIASTFLAIATGFYPLFVFPIVLILAYVSIHDVKNLFYLLFLSIPVSTAIDFGAGFSTDFPSELLMIVCMGVCFLYLLVNGRKLDKSFVLHPISILLTVHLVWILITTFTSLNVCKIPASKSLVCIQFILLVNIIDPIRNSHQKDYMVFFNQPSINGPCCYVQALTDRLFL
jgi:hypothetical protein